MQYKENVEHDKLHPDLVEILPVVELTYGTVLTEVGILPREMVMTSGHELSSKHGDGKKSKHYIAYNESGYGEAVDFRMIDLPATIATEVCGRIAQTLRIHFPGKFRVFFEGCLTKNAHCHIQLQTSNTENA